MSKFSFPLLIKYSIFQGLNVQRRQTNSRNTYLQTCIGREVATQNIHLARPTLFVGVDIKDPVKVNHYDASRREGKLAYSTSRRWCCVLVREPRTLVYISL